MSGNTSRQNWWQKGMGGLIVLVGLVLIGGAFWIAVDKWAKAEDVVLVIAPVFGVVGTLVGAFFGTKIGSDGKENVEDRLIETTKTVAQIAGERVKDADVMAKTTSNLVADRIKEIQTQSNNSIELLKSRLDRTEERLQDAELRAQVFAGALSSNEFRSLATELSAYADFSSAIQQSQRQSGEGSQGGNG